MPRIKRVFIEPFNGPQMIEPGAWLRITDLSVDMEWAVKEDHDCADYMTCDVVNALEAECPLVAAGLLYGATECAHIDAVCFAHGFNKTLPDDPRKDVYSLDEWKVWEDYFKDKARMCRDCGGCSFDVSLGDDCGHCGAKLLYQEGDEVSFMLSALDPEREPEWDGEVYAIVRRADPDDQSLVCDGVMDDPSIEPDFWVRVNEVETGREHEIRASYLEDSIVTVNHTE